QPTLNRVAHPSSCQDLLPDGCGCPKAPSELAKLYEVLPKAINKKIQNPIGPGWTVVRRERVEFALSRSRSAGAHRQRT
ncbi:MAG TPA: hypothetical protein VLJ39_01680, partial [Tepidisphaeraceae bacterium]|nr:hypothetical protein [Tepidisphaeraceae bacterium]